MQNGEQGIAVFLYLGALMAVLGVFDRQFMQPELTPHFSELVGRRFVQCHPHEAFRAADVFADVFLADSGEFFAVFVCDTADQHDYSQSLRFRYRSGPMATATISSSASG